MALRKKSNVEKVKNKLDDTLGKKDKKGKGRKVLAYVTLAAVAGRILAAKRNKNASAVSPTTDIPKAPQAKPGPDPLTNK